MTAVMIKQPNLKKMMVEQQRILSSLPLPPSPLHVYLTAPVSSLTSTYHSRVGVKAIEDKRQSQEQEGSKVSKSDNKSEDTTVLSELLNMSSRMNLEVEKVLVLTCEVLTKARLHSTVLSDDARETLARIAELSTCYPVLPPPPVV